jgi:hypothetical protein
MPPNVEAFVFAQEKLFRPPGPARLVQTIGQKIAPRTCNGTDQITTPRMPQPMEKPTHRQEKMTKSEARKAKQKGILNGEEKACVTLRNILDFITRSDHFV